MIHSPGPKPDPLRVSADAPHDRQRSANETDVLIVGAGLGGLYMLHRALSAGLSALCVDRSDDVGGTWHVNRYPGARVDTNSFNYSYSFDPDLEREWVWSERFATQPEILSYIRHVADRFKLRPNIRLDSEVSAAEFDPLQAVWTAHFSDGSSHRSRFLISAAGVLSATHVPPFPGLDVFQGVVAHTSQWPKGLDVTGRRVGVIGTGSTGVQIIPRIAEVAESLHVFQRTANFCITQNNGPVPPDAVSDWRENVSHYRDQARHSNGGSYPSLSPEHAGRELSPERRQDLLEAAWAQGSALHMMSVFSDVLTDAESNEYVAEFIRGKIRSLVDDPVTAELLSPRTHAFGTKRPVLEHGYYRTFNRENVTLVDVRERPIQRLDESGIQIGDDHVDLDLVVLATGFDAITGPLTRLGVVGLESDLAQAWADGPSTYLGMMTSGFPNFFFLAGPGSPSVLGNVLTSLELHVDWITDLLLHMRNACHDCVDVTPSAQAGWTARVADAASTTLYPDTDSWYVGANIAGKARAFLPYVGGIGSYRQACQAASAEGYPGLTFASTSQFSRQAQPGGSL